MTSIFLIEFMNETLINVAAILFVLGFLVWELPRSLKVMDEEYTQGVYPEMGRMFDIVVFLVGIVTGIFFYTRMNAIIETMKMPTFFLAFTVIFLAVPLLVLLGFLSRTLKRINDHKSITVFLVHGLLDFAHTVFFIGFSALLVPVLIFLAVDFVF